MATYKQGTRKTTERDDDSSQAQAERLSRTLGDSAQQIWLAGVGAFGRAQAEGSKLFETLAREGQDLQQRTFSEGYAGKMRDAVESGIDQARERAAGTWDRLERAFEDRVQRTLDKLDVPGREDLRELSQRVDALTTELRKAGATATAKRPAARKTATGTGATGPRPPSRRTGDTGT